MKKKRLAPPCIFCDIVAGRAPATVLADGISNIAIVPLDPVTPGHFIVLPRAHVADMYEDPSVTGDVMHDAALWARTFADRDERYASANIITSRGRPATQSVFHLHVHVVPRATNDGLALPWYSGRTSAGKAPTG